MKRSVILAAMMLCALASFAQNKERMRQRFEGMVNTHFDSLAKLHAEDFAHVLVLDGQVVPLIYTGKFPVTLNAALRKDIPFKEIKFIELIRTNTQTHDTLWHSWTKLWTARGEDSTHTAKVKRVEVAEALSSYIAVHKLNGKPVNVLAKNISNPQMLKKFIDVSKIKPDEMVVIYYETRHGFYLGYKRL